MITRNRGKSKSVVETLGLVKKNKKRVSRGGDLVKTSAAVLPLAHEETARGVEEEVGGSRDRRSSSDITLDVVDCRRCAQEVEGLNSIETTPAKWSFPPDRLNVLTIDHSTFSKCEDELGAPSESPGHDWLPPKGTHSFRVYDDVLREILEEISAVGEVFPSRRHFAQSKLRRNESKEREEDVVYVFKETRLQRLFGKMSDDLETINEEIDKEESFLASCGLVRPGVTRALRKRRLDKCKQTKHETMGRLRPNPRPRRFSDMVNPSVEVAERLTGMSRNTKRIRDRNARAAAKKLAQAKSQASHMLQSNKGVKRGRPRKSSRPLMESNKRSVSRSAVQTRPRRLVNTRHHIDWKFCYGSVSENMKLQKGGEVATTRKRRAPTSSHTSEDENEEAEEEAESNENKRGSERTRDMEGEAKHETGIARCEGVGAGVDVSFVKGVAGAALQESNVSRGSDLRRCARSMLFERKRRRNALRLAGARSRSRSGSSSESSNDFEGSARCYTRRVAVAGQSREAGFVVSQRKKGSSFCARPSRVLATARSAAASTAVGGAEEHMERVRGGHHHRRLTLLDRVVLGLTCSVVQDGDEIHIKQLHSDDLSILLQRVTETGFNINGLSTKTNANSEQEFNITLTHHPRAEASVRQVRKHNISGVQSSPSATTLVSSAFRGAQALSPTPVAAASVGGSIGVAGDAVCSDTHSDGEGGLKGRGVVVSDPPPSLRPSSTMGFNRSRVLSVASRRRGVQSGGGRMLHPLHRMGMRHLSAAAAAAAAAAVARSSGGVARRPRSRDSNAAEGDSDGGEAVSHAHQSHHPASSFVLPLAGGLGFRRHSPRKVIRKVYTGTSTVPKILNRRRLLIAGGTHLSSQQASQSLASGFPHPQPTATMATAGVAVSVSTGGSGVEEVAVAAAENKSSHPFPRVYGPVGIEAVTAEALVESSEKSKRTSRGLGEEVVHMGSSAVGAAVGSSGGSVSEVVATTIAVATTTVTAAGATLQSLPPSEEEGRKNPANSMCASQLLRLKRHHDEQPQLSSVQASPSMEVVPPTSLPPPPSLLSSQVGAPSPSLPSSQSMQKSQRKLNPVQQRVEVAGLASTVDIDDGTDFELSTALIHPPSLQPAASPAVPTTVQQTLPVVAKANEPLRGISGAPLTVRSSPSQSVLSSASTSTTTTSTMAYLHQQCCNASQYSAAVVQCVAAAGVLPQVAKTVATGKRPLIPAVTASTASMLPATTQHTFDVCGKAGLLTGRPMIAPGGGVVSTVAATTTTTNKRPVVHKYHTFRKISPKNQTTPFIAADNGITASTTNSNNNNNGNGASRPATSSQLLKSLLESGGGSALPNVHSSYQPRAPSAPPPLSAPPLPLPPPPPPSLRAHASAHCGSSLSMATARSNQPPAHQSRGTWQLGGRAIVIGASITTPSNSTHRLQSLSVTPSPTPPTTPPPSTLTDPSSTAKSVEVIASDAVPHPVLHETVES